MGNISREWILYFNRKLQVKLKVGVSGFMDILISNMYSATPLSLNGKEWTTRDSFQWEITIAGLSQWKIFWRSWTQQERWDNQGLISIGNYKFRSVKFEIGVSGYMDILILNTYPSRSSLFRDNSTGNTLVFFREGGCRSCVIGGRINSHVSRMFLAFCSRFSRVLLMCSCLL